MDKIFMLFRFHGSKLASLWAIQISYPLYVCWHYIKNSLLWMRQRDLSFLSYLAYPSGKSLHGFKTKFNTSLLPHTYFLIH